MGRFQAVVHTRAVRRYSRCWCCSLFFLIIISLQVHFIIYSSSVHRNSNGTLFCFIRRTFISSFPTSSHFINNYTYCTFSSSSCQIMFIQQFSFIQLNSYVHSDIFNFLIYIFCITSSFRPFLIIYNSRSKKNQCYDHRQQTNDCTKAFEN